MPWTERLLIRMLMRMRMRMPLTLGGSLLLTVSAPWEIGVGKAHGAPAAPLRQGLAAAPRTALSPLLQSGATSAEGPLAVTLECRLGGGPWRPCRMEVEELGSRWRLVVGSERLDFRHDGRGAVSMRQGGAGPWRDVNSRWEAPRQLCWDGVCARGEIPLD